MLYEKRVYEHRVDGRDQSPDPMITKQMCQPLYQAGFRLLVALVDIKSALQVEGLGFKPRHRHEPHKIIYHV